MVRYLILGFEKRITSKETLVGHLGGSAKEIQSEKNDAERMTVDVTTQHVSFLLTSLNPLYFSFILSFYFFPFSFFL